MVIFYMDLYEYEYSMVIFYGDIWISYEECI